VRNLLLELPAAVTLSDPHGHFGHRADSEFIDQVFRFAWPDVRSAVPTPIPGKGFNGHQRNASTRNTTKHEPPLFSPRGRIQHSGRTIGWLAHYYQFMAHPVLTNGPVISCSLHSLFFIRSDCSASNPGRAIRLCMWVTAEA